LELLEVSLRTMYFQVGDKFFQQKYGMAMGSSLSPILSNVFMEHFEKLAHYSAEYKPSLWLWYVDTFVVWPRGPEQLQNFLNHINSSRTSIQFTTETESDSVISFLDVLAIRKGQHWPLKFTENPPTLADISTSNLANPYT
jgi:hypothetical protein